MKRYTAAIGTVKFEIDDEMTFYMDLVLGLEYYRFRKYDTDDGGMKDSPKL